MSNFYEDFSEFYEDIRESFDTNFSTGFDGIYLEYFSLTDFTNFS